MKPESLQNQSKRLAIYLPNLIEGGAERVLINLAAEFAKRGFPTDFVVAQGEGVFMAGFPDSVRLVELNPFHVKFGRSILSLPALVSYIQRERPVALLTGLYANIIAVWAKKLSGVPVNLVLSEHNTLSQQRAAQSFGYRQLLPCLIRLNYPCADKIVAVSHGVADDLASTAGIAREKITVVYNPVITPEMIEKSKEKLKHPWFKPGEPPVILAVGRLSSQKDYPLLINAFAEVRRSMPVRLLILGEGPDRNELLSLLNQLELNEDVCMPGFVQNPYPYMVNASLFVLSSRWEGLPTVLIEALYCGVPLIATDCKSGPREILGGGKYGTLLPVGDCARLASGILEALNSNHVPPPEESWQPFTADCVVDQYLSLLLAE